MKKKNLKALKLNKKLVSSFVSNQNLGGAAATLLLAECDLNTKPFEMTKGEKRTCHWSCPGNNPGSCNLL